MTTPLPESGGPSVFRQPVWLRVLVSVPLVAGAVYLVASGAVAGGAGLVTGVVIAVLMLAVIVRSWQLKLAVGDDVTVVNWRKTQHLPWSDVARFGYDRSGLWIMRSNQQKVAVAAFALGRGVPKMRLHGEAVKDQLEELRRQRRKPGSGRGRNKKRT